MDPTDPLWAECKCTVTRQPSRAQPHSHLPLQKLGSLIFLFFGSCFTRLPRFDLSLTVLCGRSLDLAALAFFPWKTGIKKKKDPCHILRHEKKFQLGRNVWVNSRCQGPKWTFKKFLEPDQND